MSIKKEIQRILAEGEEISQINESLKEELNLIDGQTEKEREWGK